MTDENAVDSYVASLDRLDILVAAAGVTLGEQELEPAGYQRVIAINLLAVLPKCIQDCLPGRR